MTNVFTTSGGQRYRPTGEFRAAKPGDVWISTLQWSDIRQSIEPTQGFVMTQTAGEMPGPVIIVEPVTTRYRVTVEVDEAGLEFHRDTSGGCRAESALSDAIKAGNYEEVTDDND